tara:strand:- start:615 stop:833 length:219 start_codon:yes stop_codon:yes gene_type:complete
MDINFSSAIIILSTQRPPEFASDYDDESFQTQTNRNELETFVDACPPEKSFLNTQLWRVVYFAFSQLFLRRL